MRITLLTNEYPPYVYGGAGVHVEYLSRELAILDEGIHEIHILCFGDQNAHSGNKIVEGILPASHFPFRDNRDRKLLDTLTRNIIMTSSVKETDIVHCHTWYTHLAGCLIKEIFSIPLVITTHSLEPQRPWKEEQLGSGYRASTWIEKTAYQNADGFPNPISSSCTAMPLFVCPSIYEPFGIINLEAMTCGTPVFASDDGGIPEVVSHGETGLLVSFEPIESHSGKPRDPEKFSKDLGNAIKSLLSSPEKIKTMGAKSRERVEKYFSCKSIARQTLEFYKELTHQRWLSLIETDWRDLFLAIIWMEKSNSGLRSFVMKRYRP